MASPFSFPDRTQGDVGPIEADREETRFDRRAALGAFAAVGVAAIGFPGLAGAASGVTVYRLDAVHRQGPGGYSKGCAGCNACRNHARNKVFATRKAADAGRAHTNCNCRVIKTSISPRTYARFFGSAEKPSRDVVDLRSIRVRRSLVTGAPK
jgi:hypothetical protein